MRLVPKNITCTRLIDLKLLINLTQVETRGLSIFGTSWRDIFGVAPDWILCFGMSSCGT